MSQESENTEITSSESSLSLQRQKLDADYREQVWNGACNIASEWLHSRPAGETELTVSHRHADSSGYYTRTDLGLKTG